MEENKSKKSGGVPLILVIVILIVALVFGIVFSSWVGFTIGTIIGKALKWFFGLIKRGYYYICKAFAALLYRRQEFEADRFAVLLGYSQAMINFFQLLERTKQHAIQTSWIEDLLNDHPSNYRRVVEIQKLNNEINREERETNENLPYENPFK